MAQIDTTPFGTDANLKAYYKLSDVTDSVGTYNLTNVGTATFVSAKYDNGVSGGTQNTTRYLINTTNAGIAGGSVTISCWGKMNEEIGTSTNTFVSQQDIGVSVMFGITYDYNSGTRRIAFRRYRQGIVATEVYGTIVLGTSDWHHFVLTYDNTNLTGYHNGTVFATSGTAGGNGTLTSSSYVTVLNDGTTTPEQYCLSGIVDDVAIFNRSLGTAEIWDIFKESASTYNNLDLTSKSW